MAGKDDYRIFVGGLSWNVTERQLENAFCRFGKIIEAQLISDGYFNFQEAKYSQKNRSLDMWIFDQWIEIMMERDTGRPRGFGFITFADHRGMEDAIREMDGQEFGDRVISVNMAQPKKGGDDLDQGYRGGYSSSVRKGYGGSERSIGQDECFKCGRPGHWARDCTLAGVGRGAFSSNSRFGGRRGDRLGGDHDRYMDGRYDGGRYGDRDQFDIKDSKYGSRDRYVSERYLPGDRLANDRYGGVSADRYPLNGYDRDGGPRGGSDRYGSGGAARSDGRSYKSRAGPYDRPSRGGRPPSFDRY